MDLKIKGAKHLEIDESKPRRLKAVQVHEGHMTENALIFCLQNMKIMFCVSYFNIVSRISQ